ncbi:MAG: mucin desulfatase, partial [Lentisphaeria bacterium]
AMCVIDLDTIMPGLVHYDFGDLVRTSTSPAAEDERDLSKVQMRMPIFKALLKGYLTSTFNVLNDVEKKYMTFAGRLITFEIGLRFLTDYLNGDVYFKTKCDDHNLVRCRTQFKLVSSQEEQAEEMEAALQEILAELA